MLEIQLMFVMILDLAILLNSFTSYSSCFVDLQDFMYVRSGPLQIVLHLPLEFGCLAFLFLALLL